METISTVWLFTLICTKDCSYFNKKITNEYFNSLSYDGCIREANSLIKLKGLTGTWEIDCKPYERRIIIKENKGM